MSNISQRPIGKPLLIILGIIGIGLVYFLNQNSSEPTQSPLNVQQITIPSTKPPSTLQIKDVKSSCVEEARKYIEENKDKGVSDQSLIFGINSIYRLCLASNGLSPEDLLSYPGGNAGTAPYEGTITQDDSMSQWCQKQYSEYNACLSEYNAKMADYNQCLNQEGGLCFKPSNYCSKPLCPL